MTHRILFLLKRCLIDSSYAGGQFSCQYLKKLQCRALPQLIEPSPHPFIQLWAFRSNKNPQRLKYLSIYASNAERSIDRIHTISQTVAYLIVRLDPGNLSTLSTRSSTGRRYAINTKSRTSSNASLGSVIEFLKSIHHFIAVTLDELGFEASMSFDEANVEVADRLGDNSIQVLTNTLQYWENLSLRVAYLTMHCDAQPGSPKASSTAPTSPSQTTRPGSTFSIPYHTYLPSSHETHPSPTGFRRQSYAHQAANRASISTLSSVDLGTPWDIVRATVGLVQM